MKSHKIVEEPTVSPNAEAASDYSIFYKCDPEKNTACNKHSCYLNDGPCSATTHLEFAVQPVETVQLILPMSDEDAAELQKADECRE